MKKLFSLKIENIGSSKLFITSVIFNASGGGLLMAFLMVYFEETTSLGLKVIGISITLGRSLAMIVPLLIGKLLDTKGPRLIAISGDFITAIGFSLCFIAKNPLAIIASQFLMQAGTHMFWTSSRGLVSLAAKGANTQTWFGFIGSLRNLGLGLGTLLSSLALTFNSVYAFHLIVFLSSLLYLGSCVALYFWRPESEKNSLTHTSQKSKDSNTITYASLLKDTPYCRLLITNAGLVITAKVIP